MKTNFCLSAVALMLFQSMTLASSGSGEPGQWQTSPANPVNKQAADFAGMYAAKTLTVVDRVEKTEKGHRAFVKVAGKTCAVDMVEHRGQLQATAIDCGK